MFLRFLKMFVGNLKVIKLKKIIFEILYIVVFFFFGRSMLFVFVYIGLKYNMVSKQYEWLDGIFVMWVNWYINEFFSVEICYCVRFDLDLNL